MSDAQDQPERKFANRKHKIQHAYDQYVQFIRDTPFIKMQEDADLQEYHMFGLSDPLLLQTPEEVQLCIQSIVEENVAPELRPSFVIRYLKLISGIPESETNPGVEAYINNHLNAKTPSSRTSKSRLAGKCSAKWNTVLDNASTFDWPILQRAIRTTYTILETMKHCKEHFYTFMNHPENLRGVNAVTLGLYVTHQKVYDVPFALADYLVQSQLQQVSKKNNRGKPATPAVMRDFIVCPFQSLSETDLRDETLALANEVLAHLRGLHDAMEAVVSRIKTSATPSELEINKVDLRKWINLTLVENGSRIEVKNDADPIFGKALLTLGEQLNVTVRGKSRFRCALPGFPGRSPVGLSDETKSRAKAAADLTTAIGLWDALADFTKLVERVHHDIVTKKRNLEPYYLAEVEAKRRKAQEDEENKNKDAEDILAEHFSDTD